jgi:surface antigen Omp85-like protein/surface antigen-like variable number repeat protein
VAVIRQAMPMWLGLLCLSAPLWAQVPKSEPPAGPVVQTIAIEGATVFTPAWLASRHGLAEGIRLTRTTDEIARQIRDHYRDEGYTFAAVDASLDQATGTLTIRIDEGRFDGIEVTGVGEYARKRILEELALTPGEVFNASQANRALEEALAYAQGAIARAEPTFALLNTAGTRVLQVALRARDQRIDAIVGTLGREDWYSPVDELNVGLGMHGTLFDKAAFNHTYWNAFGTRKSGPHRFGYAIGIERAFLPNGLLQVGGGIHDLTASDDKWRLGDLEQALVALTFRNTFRDYYRRKGYELHAAVRPSGAQEFVMAWRDESHLPLQNETTFGFFRDDHAFRDNAAARPGDLRSLILAYTFESRGLDTAPSERYRRHLFDNLFSDSTDRERGLRVDWRSELAPAAFSDDFDFSRHVATARGWWTPTSRRTVSGRLMAGFSSGTLPEQRVLALGGIGTVRGYRFKEEAGNGMLLLNGEVLQRVGRTQFGGLVFIDAGRVFEPHPGFSGGWMKGVGVGLEIPGGTRVEFGWRLDDIPDSLQVLFRLRPTF